MSKQNENNDEYEVMNAKDGKLLNIGKDMKLFLDGFVLTGVYHVSFFQSPASPLQYLLAYQCQSLFSM